MIPIIWYSIKDKTLKDRKKIGGCQGLREKCGKDSKLQHWVFLSVPFLYDTIHPLDHKKARNIYFCFIDYTKAFDYMDHNKLWEILKEMEIPDHLTCLLRNIYAGQEAPVRTTHGTMDWFKTGEGIYQGCILSPCLFNVHAEYIVWNARLDDSQVGIKTAGRNINNLIYADDTTLMAESKEELKRLLMKVKEKSEKGGLKLNIKKTKIMSSGPITSWQNRRGKSGNTDRFFFLGLQNHCGWWWQSWN